MILFKKHNKAQHAQPLCGLDLRFGAPPLHYGPCARRSKALGMEREIISRVYVNEGGELFLSLESEGESIYQYIYRATAGVYWDNENHGFKSTPIQDWSIAKWFSQIVSVVKSELGVELQLSPKTNWQNIPQSDFTEIVRNHAI